MEVGMPKGRVRSIFLEKKEIQLLLDKDWSISRIAKYYGISVATVSDRLKEFQIPYRKWNYGYRAPGWKRGWWIDKDGYKMVYVPDHPYKTYRSYVREHRLVMEKHLKRYLRPGEVVHHKNGNKLDNTIENLELFAKNGIHLKKELSGKRPKWTNKGILKIRLAILKSCVRRGWILQPHNAAFLKKHSS